MKKKDKFRKKLTINTDKNIDEPLSNRVKSEGITLEPILVAHDKMAS